MRRQVAAFRDNLAQVDLAYARRKNLTAFDVVTIASMVEREAQLPRERKLVAAVIYNRLKQGIPLGIDATIRYATGNWQQPLTQSQLAIDSPYNTRTNAGLPPGADRQSRARVAAGRRQPGARRLPLLRGEARHLRRARVLLDLRGVRARPPALQRGARGARGTVADEVLVAVLGHPIGHSRSPAMHNAAFRELGLDDWRYEAIDVEPERFDEVVRAMAGQGYAGANVTIPHKLRALEVADTATPVAQAVGAANTLVFENGAVHADNTDVRGLPHRPARARPGGARGMRALVLGAGGAARAVVYALLEAGAAARGGVEPPSRAGRGARREPRGCRATQILQQRTDPEPRADGRTCERHLRRDGESRLRPPCQRGSAPHQGATAIGR